MGNFIKQQEEKKEVKEKDKTRREPNKMNWVTIILGIFSTYILANFANRILK